MVGAIFFFERQVIGTLRFFHCGGSPGKLKENTFRESLLNRPAIRVGKTIRDRYVPTGGVELRLLGFSTH